jgi:lysophospholipase L1-like esterase
MSTKSVITVSVLSTFLVCSVIVGGYKLYKVRSMKAKERDWIAKYTYKDNAYYSEALEISKIFKTQNAKIVMFGDSHSQVHWNELLGRTDVAVRSIGGDITAGLKARINQVIELKPKIVFIEAGINDIYYHVPKDTIIANLTAICDTLISYHIIPVLTAILPVGINHKDALRMNTEADEVNRGLKLYVDKTWRLYVDIRDAVTKNGYLNPAYGRSDNVHLNAKAYKEWVGEVDKILSINSFVFEDK